ncbi:MAG: radical SAM protein [Clostridiales Family XIII bacterium]|jgi:DNA repair photolyase|nr:radical SAM protein [Clostridiales Family XIII bacterium]
MITPFYGEILSHPVPLELSLGKCKYNCAYCFVRLNQSKIKYSPVSLITQLKRAEKRKNITDILLTEGYPILLSNRSDFLSPNIYPLSRATIQLLTDLGYKISFQTKGGRPHDIKECLDIIDYQSIWYITVTTLNETLSKKIEPNAPGPGARLEAIKTIVKRGHKVIIGLNPCVEEWHGGKPFDIINKFRDSGAYGVYIQELHLNSNQSRNLSEHENRNLGEITIKKALASKNDDIVDYIREIGSYCSKVGMEVKSDYYNPNSKIYSSFKEVYSKCFPTFEDIINDFYKQEIDTCFVNFDTFWESLTRVNKFPDGKYNFRDYIACLNRSLLYNQAIDLSNISFKSLIKFIFGDERIAVGPKILDNFAFVLDDDDYLAVDEKEIPVYYYNKKGNLNHYISLDKIQKIDKTIIIDTIYED